MLYIGDGGGIKLTRGDTARFAVNILNTYTGEPYEIKPDDLLNFTVKKTTKDSEPILIQKAVTGDTQIHITPEDTSLLPYGRYKYDVQLTLPNGDVYTVIEPSTFEVTPEVTF